MSLPTIEALTLLLFCIICATAHSVPLPTISALIHYT
jgi:hypothetical protein